jgi:hypothetical protein
MPTWPRGACAGGHHREGGRLGGSPLAGLTQYLTHDAIQQTMRDVAGLAPATTYVATFIIPPKAADPGRPRPARPDSPDKQGTGDTVAEPFTPDQFARLAQESGLRNPAIITSGTLTERYFTGRDDGLRPCSGEQILTASV